MTQSEQGALRNGVHPVTTNGRRPTPDGGPAVDPRNRLNALTGRQWIQETKSVWFQRGLGKSHEHTAIEREHPAPFSYQDVQRLIEFFTKPGGTVLDPFVGVGSTLKACALSGRNGVGIEVVARWAEAAAQRLRTELDGTVLARTTQVIRHGDARDLISEIPQDAVDFVVTSPPYWGILNKKPDHKVRTHRVEGGLATRYSDDEADLANIPSYETFLSELGRVFAGCHRVLGGGRYLAVVVGDFRHRNKYVPYHADLIRLLTERMTETPFDLSGITILAQNAKPLFPYGYPFAYVPNVHHQYVLIFRKPASSTGSHELGEGVSGGRSSGRSAPAPVAQRRGVALAMMSVTRERKGMASNGAARSRPSKRR